MLAADLHCYRELQRLNENLKQGRCPALSTAKTGKEFDFRPKDPLNNIRDSTNHFQDGLVSKLGQFYFPLSSLEDSSVIRDEAREEYEMENQLLKQLSANMEEATNKMDQIQKAELPEPHALRSHRLDDILGGYFKYTDNLMNVWVHQAEIDFGELADYVRRCQV